MTESSPGLALNEQVVGLLGGVRTLLAVAGDAARDEPRVPAPQRRGVQSQPCDGPGQQVLDEDVRRGDDLLQRVRVRAPAWPLRGQNESKTEASEGL